jgi:hypothetical protein
MEEKTVLKKVVREIEIELYCEHTGMSFNTIWSPGYPWNINVNGADLYKEGKIQELLHIFNSVKTKFDKIIRRLEREYKQFDQIVSELPSVEEKE